MQGNGYPLLPAALYCPVTGTAFHLGYSVLIKTRVKQICAGCYYSNNKITAAITPATVRYTPELNNFVPGLNIQKADIDINSMATPKMMVK